MNSGKLFWFIITLMVAGLIVYFFINHDIAKSPSAGNPFPSSDSNTDQNKTFNNLSSDFGNNNFSVPILMYHHVLKSEDGSLTVTTKVFDEQMNYLAHQGYSVVSLDDVFKHSADSAWLDKKVVVTFDDGYKDVVNNAYPIMSNYGFKGTIFLITNMVGHAGYMNWWDVKFLDRKKWNIGSHTLNHPDLTKKITKDQAHNEIFASKSIIEEEIAKKIYFFCYPAGKYNSEIESMLNDAGYWGAVTTKSGIDNSTGEPYELKRVRINNSVGVDGLAWKLKETSYPSGTDNSNY